MSRPTPSERNSALNLNNLSGAHIFGSNPGGGNRADRNLHIPSFADLIDFDKILRSREQSLTTRLPSPPPTNSSMENLNNLFGNESNLFNNMGGGSNEFRNNGLFGPNENLFRGNSNDTLQSLLNERNNPGFGRNFNSNPFESSVGNGLGNGMGNGLGNGMGNSLGNGMGNSLGNGLGNSLGNGLGNSLGNGLGSGLGNGIGTGFNRGLNSVFDRDSNLGRRMNNMQNFMNASRGSTNGL